MSAAVVSDAIVVGGGIMGAATAFFLRRRGLRVTLLERGLVGQQASGVNFGNVRRQGRFLPQVPLANRSRAVWGRLNALLGEDAEFITPGHIRVAFRPEDVARLEQHVADVRPYGLELEMISGNALRARFPFLAGNILAGSFSPLDGHANPRLAAPAFGRAARREGALVVEGRGGCVGWVEEHHRRRRRRQQRQQQQQRRRRRHLLPPLRRRQRRDHLPPRPSSSPTSSSKTPEGSIPPPPTQTAGPRCAPRPTRRSTTAPRPRRCFPPSRRARAPTAASSGC